MSNILISKLHGYLHKHPIDIFIEQCPTTLTTPPPTTPTTEVITTTTTTTKKPTTGTKNNVCPDLCPGIGNNFSGNVRDPANDRHYVGCWQGRTVGCQRCPANLIFNEAINQCVYPDSLPNLS